MQRMIAILGYRVTGIALLIDACRKMRRHALVTLGAILLAFISTQMNAHAEIRADQKYIEPIKKSSGITPVAIDSFGDSIDLSTGSVEFKWTDIDVPGNNSLPVRLQRSLVIEDKEASASELGGFGAAGNIDIPYLKGVFPTTGWQVDGANPNARCSMYGAPPALTQISASDYWNGNSMHIPWEGDQMMLSGPAAPLPQPAGGTTIMTKKFWAFKCSPSTKNGYPGEGFIALSPEGDTYYFDWVVSKNYGRFSKRFGNYAHSTATMDRKLVYFLVTKIEDRFGNWVSYEYSGDKLSRISSSDNRYIQIDSWNGGNIASVSSSVGTWTYAYAPNSLVTTQPDGAHWQYVSSGALDVEPTPALPLYTGYVGPDGQPRCPAPEPSSGNYGLAVTQPSGATATFTFTVMRHGKNNIPKLCNSFIDEGLMSYRYLTIPNFSDTLTLVSKSVTGPGLATMQWTYTYVGGGIGLAFEDICSDPPTPLACPKTKATEVRGPERSFRRYTFGKMYKLNSGQLLQVDEGYETGSSPNVQAVILKTTMNEYMTAAEVSTQPFPDRVGSPGSYRFDDVEMASLRPLKQARVTQDGATFTNTRSNFDVFARPKQVTKSSAPVP